MPFQKGNKLGKPPKLDPDLRGARLLNQYEVERLLNQFHNMPVDDVIAFTKDQKNPIGQVLVARIFVEAVRSGDEKKLDFIYTRLIGKPKEVVEVTHKKNYHDEIMNMIDEINNAKDVTPKLGHNE